MKRLQVVAALTAALLVGYVAWFSLPPRDTVVHAQVAGRPVNGPTTRANLASPWQHGYAWLVTDCETAAACDTGGGTFPKILIYNASTPGWEIASGAGGAGDIGYGPDPPASCTPGTAPTVWFDSDATSGQNWLGCTATDVWTVLGISPPLQSIAANGLISLSGTEVQVNDLTTKECLFSNPVAGHSALCQLQWPYAFTITEAYCNTDVATSTADIEFEQRLRSEPDLGQEILTENNFATHASWNVTGDLTDSTGAAVYTHSTGAGTLTQPSASFDATQRASYIYTFGYTVSGASGDPACSVTTSFASTSTALTISNGAQSTSVTAAASPGDFVISCTSTSGGFTIDDVTLTAAQGIEVFGSDLQCDTNGATKNSSFNDATVPANTPVSLTITTVANAPEKLRVYVTGRYTP